MDVAAGTSHGSLPGGRGSPWLCPELVFGTAHSTASKAQGTRRAHRGPVLLQRQEQKHELEMAEKHQGMDLLDRALKPEYRLCWTDVK